jgi:hypothetical protein
MKTMCISNFRQLIITVFFLFMGLVAQAQDFSYVYIQGDKKTPIYVKVEGEMLPRYGKNYALISRLAPGPLNIDILFQQNEFPPLHFRILVPENGKRAFLITKKDDAFLLYDLEQNFYLQPNNSIDDDHLPAVLNNKLLAEQQAKTVMSPVAKEVDKSTASVTEIERKGADSVILPPVVMPKAEEVTTQVAATKEIPVAVVDSTKPKFIENIELSNNQTPTKSIEQTDPSVKAANTSTEKTIDTTANNTSAIVAIPNSDCKKSVSTIDFQKILNGLSAKKTEDQKLGVFLEANNRQQGCYTTAMAEQIALTLESNSARYSVLKTMFPKISDQSNYAQLKTVFSDDEWKEHFMDLLSNKK